MWLDVGVLVCVGDLVCQSCGLILCWFISPFKFVAPC